ncbi:cuticle protein 16.5-like [Anopheles ziemanni]|uniref:cuticle protein 16.5-like n=1 Tax=Anopheles coustani TaxID=139045 RepID=UPI00265AF561|nr:cuticle protein 16.5-like [Anopheles coustani]XP_058167440.1 cuticle protein 16.5-like [Anopheles ziemanni]
MFKIACLFAILAVASVSAKADPKPGVFAYAAPAAYVAAPAAYVAEGAAVYERTFHGNTAPLAYTYAAPYVAAAPVAYSSPYVAAAPAQVLLK